MAPVVIALPDGDMCAEVARFLSRAGLGGVVVLGMLDNDVADAMTPVEWAAYHARLERAYQAQQRAAAAAAERCDTGDAAQEGLGRTGRAWQPCLELDGGAP